MGVQRAYAFANELLKYNYDITVVTTKKYPCDSPFNKSKILPVHNLNVLEVEYLPRFFCRLHPFFIRLIEKAYIYYCQNLSLDNHYCNSFRNLWIKESIAILKLNGIQYDIVLSTFSPFESHLLASEIINLELAKKWVADYRDLFVQSELDKSLKMNNLRYIEKTIISSKANLITAASRGFANILEESMGVPALPLYNGWDESFYNQIKACKISKNIRDASISTSFSFFGSIYWENMAWKEFLQCIRDFNRNNKMVSVNIYGQYPASNPYVSYIMNHFKFVSFCGRIDHMNIPMAMSHSNILLAFTANVSYGECVVPAKIFEYLVSGRPVINYGHIPGSEASRILESCGCGKEVLTPSALRLELSSLSESSSPKWFRPNSNQIKKYSRQSAMSKLHLHLSQSSLFE